VKSHPKGREDNSLLEIHLSTTSDDDKRAEEKLRRAVMYLSRLVGDIGGKFIVYS
jgi:hypothetical protein